MLHKVLCLFTTPGNTGSATEKSRVGRRKSWRGDPENAKGTRFTQHVQVGPCGELRSPCISNQQLYFFAVLLNSLWAC